MADDPQLIENTLFCQACGTQLAPALLACPNCRRLVHAEALKTLADQAERAERDEQLALAVESWERAQAMLPPESRQWDVIQARLQALRARMDGFAAPERRAAAGGGPHKKQLGGFAAIGALLLSLLGKGKLLLLGLTKASTVLTMLLSMGVYWTAYGWKFAAGLVISIYIHEMGHVAALRRLGIKATAPMFIPGLGAIVRLRESPRSPRDDAVIGLAGPIWGTAAAVGAYAVYHMTRWPSWAAIGVVGAWINLFNLTPIWQLDGGRGFNSLSRTQRWMAAVVIATFYFYSNEGLLMLLLVVAIARALGKAPAGNDARTWITYVLLLAVLTLFCGQHVPLG